MQLPKIPDYQDIDLDLVLSALAIICIAVLVLLVRPQVAGI